MRASASEVFLVCLVALFIKLVHAIVVERRLKRLMPPGPRSLPLIGNALQLTKAPWLRLTEWRRQYGAQRLNLHAWPLTYNYFSPSGPIYSIFAFGQPVIVVNDFKSAADLLGMFTSTRHIALTDRDRFTDRRSIIYADRPPYIMAREILTNNMFIAFMGYGEL